MWFVCVDDMSAQKNWVLRGPFLQRLLGHPGLWSFILVWFVSVATEPSFICLLLILAVTSRVSPWPLWRKSMGKNHDGSLIDCCRSVSPSLVDMLFLSGCRCSSGLYWFLLEIILWFSSMDACWFIENCRSQSRCSLCLRTSSAHQRHQ